MIPHNTKRGAAALARLKAYQGVPPPYDKIKRMVIPDALKVLMLQAGHKYCLLGRLSSEVGWNHFDTIKELREKEEGEGTTFAEGQVSDGDGAVEIGGDDKGGGGVGGVGGICCGVGDVKGGGGVEGTCCGVAFEVVTGGGGSGNTMSVM
ncbi:hypothetical protein NL676_023545 [Syzygium grande]|nr:hypothetical protein NL676_023545 [Syzygium grande]